MKRFLLAAVAALALAAPACAGDATCNSWAVSELHTGQTLRGAMDRIDAEALAIDAEDRGRHGHIGKLDPDLQARFDRNIALGHQLAHAAREFIRGSWSFDAFCSGEVDIPTLRELRTYKEVLDIFVKYD